MCPVCVYFMLPTALLWSKNKEVEAEVDSIYVSKLNSLRSANLIRGGRFYRNAPKSCSRYSWSADDKKNVFPNVKRVKFPWRGMFAHGKQGWQLNPTEVSSSASTVTITQAALLPLYIQSMAIALQGSDDISNEWLPLVCFFVCLCRVCGNDHWAEVAFGGLG